MGRCKILLIDFLNLQSLPLIKYSHISQYHQLAGPSKSMQLQATDLLANFNSSNALFVSWKWKKQRAAFFAQNADNTQHFFQTGFSSLLSAKKSSANRCTQVSFHCFQNDDERIIFHCVIVLLLLEEHNWLIPCVLLAIEEAFGQESFFSRYFAARLVEWTTKSAKSNVWRNLSFKAWLIKSLQADRLCEKLNCFKHFQQDF